MRAIIEIFLAIIFSAALGTGSLKIIKSKVKKEALLKATRATKLRILYKKINKII